MKKLLVAAGVLAMLSGCAAHTQPVPTNLVRQISICSEGPGGCLRRCYTAEEKMQPVLTCLRSARTRRRAEADVNAYAGSTMRITVLYVNNSRKTFVCKAGCFLREDVLPWKQIPPEAFAGLYQFLCMTPGDEPLRVHMHSQLLRAQRIPGESEKLLEKKRFFENYVCAKMM